MGMKCSRCGVILIGVEVWSHDRWGIPLPAGHRFPISKYGLLREQRGLGLPWSEVLVERGRRSVGGTLCAARRALSRGIGMNLGGGTHHAGRDFARGYCLFNDVAVTLARLRAE